MFLIFTLGALSVVLALVLTPLVRDYVGKLGFLDHPDGVRKKHAAPVPRVGGIAIVISYIITFAIALALPFTYTDHLHRSLPEILPLTLVGSVVLMTGVLDDLIGLAAWHATRMVFGGSGSGKSTLLRNMLAGDIAAGHGVTVVDPHGQLIDEILENHIPRQPRRWECVASHGSSFLLCRRDRRAAKP